MTDVATIAAGFQSLKAAFDIGKSLLNMGVSAEVSSRISEMNERILSAQESAIAGRDYQATLLKQVRELEEQIAEFETWEAEAQTYELKDLAFRPQGIAAYAFAPKESTHLGEPPHFICAKCFYEKHKSILQGSAISHSTIVLMCPRCSNSIFASKNYFYAKS